MGAILWTVMIACGMFGFAWWRGRIRAHKRQAALDAYAEREIARTAHQS
jgi:hypothetical protein